MTNEVYVEQKTNNKTERCWMKGCNNQVEYYVIRTDGHHKLVVPTCEYHMVDMYERQVDFLFKSKIVSLVKHAQTKGLTEPELILSFVKQQDIENVTLEDVKKILELNLC